MTPAVAFDESLEEGTGVCKAIGGAINMLLLCVDYYTDYDR